MDSDGNLHPSDIRELLDEEIESDNSESDIGEDAEEVPDDISLADFSSGSGEEFVPNFDELSSDDSDDVLDVRPRPRPNIPSNVVPNVPSTSPCNSFATPSKSYMVQSISSGI